MNAPDPNPYAAPVADVNASEFAPAVELVPAARLARFWASGADGLLYLVPGVMIGIGVFAMGGLEALTTDHGGNALGLLISAGGLLAFLSLFVFQTYRVSTTGQTLGKKWMEIRIVKMDGSAVTFTSAFLLRSFVPGLLGAIPYVGKPFGLIDMLFIFREDRRCIHDLLADTQVVEAARPEGGTIGPS